MNREECLIEMRKIKQLQGVPVYIYSTSYTLKDENDAIRLGAAGYIKKPPKIEEFVEILSGIISTR